MGRYVSQDPIGLAGGGNFYAYPLDPLGWVDPLGLEEGSPSNIAKRRAIDNIAKGYDGSAAWCFSCKKGKFPVNTNKCNKFVYDVTDEAGANATTQGRQPLAAEWASRQTTIPNWRVLGPGETPQPGDIAAYRLPGGGTRFSGHTVVVISDGAGAITNISAHSAAVWTAPGQFSDNPQTVYRRYTGD